MNNHDERLDAALLATAIALEIWARTLKAMDGDTRQVTALEDIHAIIIKLRNTKT